MAVLPEKLVEALQGHYTVERELGWGEMATVFLAHDLRHGRRVALKVLNPNLVPEHCAEWFRREILVAARRQHPHILTVLTYLALGDQEAALDRCEPPLRVPNFLSPAWLRIDPTLEDLRHTARFQKLLAAT